MSSVHLCSFTDAIFTYTLNGREYHCEFSRWFGPLWTDKDGMPWKVQPQPGGKHWEQFEEWYEASSYKPEQAADGGLRVSNV